MQALGWSIGAVCVSAIDDAGTKLCKGDRGKVVGPGTSAGGDAGQRVLADYGAKGQVNVLAKEQIITVAEYERQQAAKAAAEKMAAEKAAAAKAAAEKMAAEKAAEAKAAVNRAAVERLTDLLGYAPGSVDRAQLRTAILAAREAQVVGTLLTKAETLLQRAEQLAAEKATAAKAAALGLLQPLEALSLDADTLRTATAAAVAYCDAQGADNVSDLVERASKLIAHP